MENCHAMMSVNRTSAVRFLAGLLILMWVLLLSQQIYYYAGVALSMGCAIVGLPSLKRLLQRRKAARFALLTALFALIWVAAGSAFFGSLDIQFYTRIGYFYFNIASAAGIAYILDRYARLSPEGSIELIIKVFFIYALLNVLALLYQPFQDASLLLFRMDEHQAALYEQQPYRFFGLAGFNGFGVALIYPLLVALLFTSSAGKTKFGIAAVFLFTVVGLFGSRIAGILSLLVALALSPPKVKLFILMFLFASLAYILSIIEDSETLKWAFELLYAYVNGEGLVTESSNVLFERMYFVPDSWVTIFAGDFQFLNLDGSYYGHTDAGFMRMMLYFGVFGSVFYYLSFVAMSLLVKFKHIFILLAIMIVSEIKGDAILSSPASKLYFLIVFVSLGKEMASANRLLSFRAKRPAIPEV
jgi:hypothetical protein